MSNSKLQSCKKSFLFLSFFSVVIFFSSSTYSQEANNNEPTISYVSGSGPYTIGTRETEIVITSDVDAKCKASLVDSDNLSDWKKYLTTDDNRTHRIRAKLFSDENTTRYIRCRNLATAEINTTSFNFLIYFSQVSVISTPENFQVGRSNSEDGEFVLSWDIVSAAARYRLMEQGLDGLWSEIALIGLPLSVDMSRPVSGDYQYKIAACSDLTDENCSAFTSTITVWIGAMQSGDAPVISYVLGTGPHPNSVDKIEMIVATDINATCRGNYLDTGDFSDWNKHLSTDDNRLHRIWVPISGAGNTEKYVRCQSTNTQATNQTSFVFPITVAESSDLPIPDNFRVDATPNTGNYLLEWDAVDNAVSYLLKETQDGENWTRIVVSGDELELSLAKTDDAEYQYYLMACDDELGLECSKCSSALSVVVVGSNDNNLAPVINSTPLLNGTESVVYVYDVNATDPNNIDILTYSLINPPQDMTILSDSGEISWTPTIDQIGTHTIEVRATDDAGLFDTQSYQLVIAESNQSPEFTSVAVTDATEGLTYNYTLTATDPNVGDTLTFSLSQSPEGMSLDPNTNVISWVPSADQVATFVVIVTVADDAGLTATQAYDLIVENVNNAPQFSSVPIKDAQELEDYTYQLTATDQDADVLTFDASNPPQGMSLSIDGLLSWNPTIGQEGDHDISLTVTDPLGLSDTQNYILVVTRRSNTAAVAEDQSLSGTEDISINITLTATDIDDDPLTYEVVSQPVNGVLTGVGENLVYTPNVNFFGNDSFTFKANDGVEDSNVATIILTIDAGNSSPTITSFPSTIGTVDHQYVYSIVAEDTDGDQLIYQKTEGPIELTVDAITGVLNWTPNSMNIGSHNVKIRVDDGKGGTASQDYLLTISEQANRSPIIVSVPAPTGVVNEAYIYNIVATDEDLDPLSYELVSGPEGMTVGIFSGTLHWIANGQQTGNFQVIVVVSDGKGATVQQRFQVEIILGDNQPPQITSAAVLNTLAEQLYSYPIIANDPDGETLDFVLVTSPQGMIINSQTGLISWVPGVEQVGSHTVNIRVFDPKLVFAEQIFDISVTSTSDNLPPAIISTSALSVNANENYRYDIVATDPENDELTYSIEQAPINTYFGESDSSIVWSVDKTQTSGNLELNEQCLVKGSPIENAGIVTIDPELIWTSNVQSLNRPSVAPLFDTNNDGVVTAKDKSYLILNQHSAFVDSADSWIAVIDPENWSTVWVSETEFRAASSLAVADIDGDGTPEIVGFGKKGSGKVIAYDNLGNKLWENTEYIDRDTTYNYGKITIADINGNGKSEILASDHVIDYQGNLLWVASGVDGAAHANYSYALDVDLDGQFEVINSGRIFTNTGELYSEYSSIKYQSVPINLDTDEQPELVHPSGSSIEAVEIDGTVLWTTGVGASAMHPTVADLDKDGYSEIIVPTQHLLSVLDRNGNLLWTSEFVDSSRATSVTVYDINDDGLSEIIANDSSYFRIYDGQTGVILYEKANPSATGAEYPVIADLDNDGFGELIISANNGVQIYKNKYDNWGYAPPVWNQYHFNSDNIRGDLTPPSEPTHSWLQNRGELTVVPNEDRLLADLVVKNIELKQVNSDRYISADILNRGMAVSKADTSVSFYLGSPDDDGVKLGETLIGKIESNSIETVEIIVTDVNIEDNIYIVVDSGSDVEECIENNNTGIGVLFKVKVSDPLGLFDEQDYLINILDQNEAPEIISTAGSSGLQGEYFHYPIKATDINIGDSLRYSIVSVPEGATLNTVDGLLRFKMVESGTFDFEIKVSDLAGLEVNQQFSLTVIETSATNKPPVFESTPLKVVPQDSYYSYQVDVSDPESDEISISLVVTPNDMTISNDGLIEWTPTYSDTGLNQIIIRATDTLGNYSEQAFFIDVLQLLIENTAPSIDSTPKFTIRPDENYEYQVTATDIDGDVLNFELDTFPNGMTITNAGKIDWTPSVNETGSHLVIIEVDDEHGSKAHQTYYLEVLENSDPIIVSVPSLTGLIGVEYQYTVIANDVDGDVITYNLLDNPTGMILNTTSGVITWTPTIDFVGLNNVSTQAVDSYGATSTQTYSIAVNFLDVNEGPIITSEPTYEGESELSYIYQVVAEDGDGDILNYELTSAPSGMSVDGNGLVSWTPTSLQSGEHSIVIQVDDGHLSFTQSYTLTIYDEPLPLNIDTTITPKNVVVNENVTIDVSSTGGSGLRQTTLTINGIAQTLVDGNTTYTPIEKGRYDVQVTVTDDIQTVIDDEFFTVGDSADITPPIITIYSPGEHAEITNLADVVASIEDDNLADYFVALIPADVELNYDNAIILARGSSNVTNDIVAQLDPTMLVNGLYNIVIQAEDLNGQQSVNSVTVLVTGDLKVGNFSITLLDKNIPLAGIPINVTRTYDSRRKSREYDFGYGWTIDYQNIKIEESRDPGLGWELTEFSSGPLGILKTYCVEPQGSPLITVTLPNGDVETFNVEASPKCNEVIPIFDVDLAFTATDETDSTLVSLNDSAGRLLENNLVETSTFTNPLNPSQYQLTTRTGYIYQLDQSFGIETVTDPNGNILTYSDSGIVHSSGKSVDFVRDTDGRITSVTDPKGQVVSYQYGATGDLTSVTDELGNTTTYTYNSKHGLLDIIDPLGRAIVKNIYDDEGRLIAQEDNQGNRTNFSHDLAGRQSVVTDRLGRATTLYYDDEGNVTRQVDALGQITTFTFDDNNNQLSKTDPLNRNSTATYNDQDDQLTQTDPLGNRVAFSYNDRGQELTVSDEKNNVFTNVYDSVGNLTSITDPQNNVVSNTINSQGLPLTVTDALGNVTTFTYDGDGNKLTETDPSGAVTSFIYDSNNNVLTQTLSRTLSDNSVVNETTTFVYDKMDRVIQTTDPLGNISTVEFDLIGNQVANIDALNRRTETDYDAYRRVIEIRYPGGEKENKTYDLEGNLLTQTDRNGNVTSFEYDKLNRLIKTTFADNRFVQTEYDAVGQVTAEIDALGNRTVHEYDLAGRRIKTTDALNNVHQFTYDKSGNLASEIDALSNTTSYTYDSLDRKTQTTFANLSTMLSGFDPLARKTSSTDQANVSTSYAYDSVGRLTSVTDVEGNITSYTFDEAGNKLTQTDAEGRVTNWTYDSLGRVLTRTLPLGQVESFTHDLVGNVLTHTDFNGELKTFVYDSNNRITSITYSLDNSTDTFTYDLNGNRLTGTSALGSWTYTYDSMNRLSSEAKPSGETLDYSYDFNGNKIEIKITLANGNIETETSSYNALNRLVAVTDKDNNITTYGYDLVGNQTSVSYQNGASQTFAYDSLNRLIRVNHFDGTGALIKKFDYTLNDTGRRSQIDETNGRSTAYTYDTLYRLTGENITDAINGNRATTYEYNKVGNRLAEIIDGVRNEFTFDNNDRLLTNGSTIYTFDDNGNTLTEVDGITTKTFTYNAQNKLASFSDGVASINYAYNLSGIRVSQSTASDTTNYLVDSNRDYAQVIAETDVSNTVVKRYVYGNDLISQTFNGETYFYLVDGLGSTRHLIDSSGQLTDSYDFDAFGELLNQTGSTENAYLYTGEQLDSSLDQYYLRARYYDQGIGRFLQQDTWMGNDSDPITLHKYLYANADPVNHIDPTGNFSIGSVMSAINTAATLASVAQTSYSIGGVLYGQAVGDEPLDFSSENIKQIGFAVAFSFGATKVLKILSKSKKFKKLLKKRKLMRGVNSSNAGYSDAQRGFVGGSYLDFLRPSTYSSDAAARHNSVTTIGSIFSSWTTKRRIAKNFATRDASAPMKRSHGIIITAKIMTFRIFKSPDRHNILGLGKEGEWLVVGPVQGIPRPVK